MAAVQSVQCFTKQELAEFASGRMSLERLDFVSAHVDTCIICQGTISNLDEQPDSFIRDLRHLPGQEDPVEESACDAVVDQLVKQRSDQIGPTEPARTVPDSIGGYRVIEPVGVGGMGVVYKAQHPKLKRLVAVKLLPFHRWAGPAAVARFEREMEVIGALDHPNIVRASDAGDEAGMHFLVMDFVDGLDLARLVRRIGPLRIADACEIIRQTAQGLAHVHEASLVHRDIKPSNVMVTRSGQVKILDLGLAMLSEQYLEGEDNLTTIGQLMGTLDYMAPEQAADSHQVDARADVYSLGATLFQLLTGQAPYGGSRYNSLLKKVLALASAPVPSAKATRGDLPEEVEQIIGHCLAKDPQQRFATADEMACALAPFTAGADLPGLMREAGERQEADPLKHSAWSMAAVLGDRKEPASRKPEVNASGGGKRLSGFMQLLGAAAFFAFVMLAVMVFRLITDRGELIVRSEDPHARILVRHEDGRPVKELTLEQGQGKITVRSGQYAVDLLSDADRLTLSQNQFRMSRGDRVVLTVEHKPAGPRGADLDVYGAVGDGAPGGPGGGGSAGGGLAGGPLPGSVYSATGYGVGDVAGGSGYGSDMALGGDHGTDESLYVSNDAIRARLVYDGKSFSDWLTVMGTERNPERLSEAVQAVAVLAPEAGSEDAAWNLLHVMRAFGSSSIGSDAQGKLIEQGYLTLFRLDPTSVTRAIASEIGQGNFNSRQFLSLLIGMLRSYAGQQGSELNVSCNRLRTALIQAAPDMMPVLLEMSRHSDLNLSRWSMEFAGLLASTLDLEAQEIPGFVPRFQEALKSNDEATVFNAAVVLSRCAPDTEGLARILVRYASDPWRQSQALEAIGRLGTAAESIVLQLAELLKKEVTTITDPSGFGGYGGGAGGMGGGYPGMMSGGMSMGYGMPPTPPGILSTLEALGPSAAEALPILRQFAAQEGPHQDLARQMLERLQSQMGTAPPGKNPSDPATESLDPFGAPKDGDPFR